MSRNVVPLCRPWKAKNGCVADCVIGIYCNEKDGCSVFEIFGNVFFEMKLDFLSRKKRNRQITNVDIQTLG